MKRWGDKLYLSYGEFQVILTRGLFLDISTPIGDISAVSGGNTRHDDTPKTPTASGQQDSSTDKKSSQTEHCKDFS